MCGPMHTASDGRSGCVAPTPTHGLSTRDPTKGRCPLESRGELRSLDPHVRFAHSDTTEGVHPQDHQNVHRQDHQEVYPNGHLQLQSEI